MTTFNDVYTLHFEKILPFMVERKFCFSNVKSRQGTLKSKHVLYTTQNPLIKTTYSTEKQPDDFLKENVIQVLCWNYLKTLTDFVNNSKILSQLNKLSLMSKEYNSLTKNTIQSLEYDLSKLHNNLFLIIKNSQYTFKDINNNRSLFKLNLNVLIGSVLLFIVHVMYRNVLYDTLILIGVLVYIYIIRVDNLNIRVGSAVV